MVTFSVNGTSAALSAQPYYATIEVTVPGGGVTDPVQDYQVVLNVTPANNIAAPDPDPQGLIFISTAPGALPPQVVTVGSSSAGVSYSATTDGSSWLSVSPASGMTSSAVAGSIEHLGEHDGSRQRRVSRRNQLFDCRPGAHGEHNADRGRACGGTRDFRRLGQGHIAGVHAYADHSDTNRSGEQLLAADVLADTA